MVTKRAPVGANEKGSFGNLVSNAFKRSPSFGSNKVLRECWTPRGNEDKVFPSASLSSLVQCGITAGGGWYGEQMQRMWGVCMVSRDHMEWYGGYGLVGKDMVWYGRDCMVSRGAAANTWGAGRGAPSNEGITAGCLRPQFNPHPPGNVTSSLVNTENL